MLQRWQSFFLGLIVIFSLLLCFLNLARLKGPGDVDHIIKASGVFRSGEEVAADKTRSYILIFPLLISLAVIAATALFMFRNRKRQKQLCIVLAFLDGALIITLSYYILSAGSQSGGIIKPELPLILPLLILVSALLAYRGVRKDEELVKSFDRLR